MKTFSYTCTTCRKVHQGIPSLDAKAPVYYYNLSEEAIKTRVHLTSDTCVLQLDQNHYFVRGRLIIPVNGYQDHMQFGVWVSLSEVNFFRFQEIYDLKQRQQEPAMLGWFSTAIYSLTDTTQLKAKVIFQDNGIRPLIELEPTNHPLSVHQRKGIDPNLVGKILEYYEHPA